MKKIALLLISIVSTINGALLHRSKKYLPKDGSGALITNVSKKIEYSNAHQFALDYWAYWTRGPKAFLEKQTKSNFNYINNETLKKGYKPLNLSSEDIKLIKFFTESYIPTEFKSVHSKLPDWVEAEYKNVTLEVLKEIINDDYYSFLGPEEIRQGLAEHIIQTYYKINYHSPKYLYFKKDIFKDKSKEEINKYLNETNLAGEIRDILKLSLKAFKYINNIKVENNKIDPIHPNVEYIIVSANDLQDTNHPNPHTNHPNLEVINRLNLILNQNPNLIVVLAFNDDLDQISNITIPNTIKKLIITGANVTRIGSAFLSRCTALTAIDLSALHNVATIEHNFLYDCTALKAIDLSALQSLTSIGDDFLRNCTALKAIDLSALHNVTSVGNYFLSGCTALKAIDLSALQSLTSIGYNFLSHCSSLTTINLSGLHNLTIIGYNFLSVCAALKAIDLSGLKNVKSIENRFLSRCAALEVIDLSALHNLTSIGDYFLCNCEALKTIDLSGLHSLTRIGDNFLHECATLITIDLSALHNLTSIGNNFLFRCEALKAIDLSALHNLTSIGDDFLYRCAALTAIDLSALHNLTSIRDGFLCNCEALKAIDLSVLHNLTYIGDYFLFDCRALTNIKIKQKTYDLILKKDQKFFEQFPELKQENIIIEEAFPSSKLKQENIIIEEALPSSNQKTDSDMIIKSA